MVGLSHNRCVAIARIYDATVHATIRGLRYLFSYYKAIVNDLNAQIEKVKIEEERVAISVAQGRDDGKIIEDCVMNWQKDVEKIKSRADELLRQRPPWTCFKVVELRDPVNLFLLGRKVAHLKMRVVKLTIEGKILLQNEIAHLAPTTADVPLSDTPYQDFGSRKEVYLKLWEALTNQDGYPIIGIYGPPGVGKTRMMLQVWKDAKDDMIFDKVTRVTVGRGEIDLINIQHQLAEKLGCHLEWSDNVERRASQLKNSLMNCGKTLVIIDDVWRFIPLKKIGIPFDDGISKGCKILLASRSQHVCSGNNCEDPIQIKTLTEGEAWEMFQKTVGFRRIKSLHDASLAKKVCEYVWKKSAGAPLLIEVVGKALKFRSEYVWMDALHNLENGRFDEIDGIDMEALNISGENLGN